MHSLWNGRFDGDEAPHLRIFQRVTTHPLEDIANNTGNRRDSYQLLGFQCDEGVKRNQGRVGAKTAPDTIRQAMANLPYSNGANQTPTMAINDSGNVTCNGDDLVTAQQQLAHGVCHICTQNHTPVILGGGHETAFGVFQGLHQYYGTDIKIGILNFDAHFDLRTTDNNIPTSGTPFYDAYRLCEQDGRPYHYCCMGIAQSGNTKALFDKADSLGVKYLYDRDVTLNPDKATQMVLDFAGSVDVIYMTIDMDTFNASLAPGVSATNPMGISPAWVEHCMIELSKTNTPIIALDVVEVNPQHDHNGITAKLAGRLIHTFISHNSR